MNTGIAQQMKGNPKNIYRAGMDLDRIYTFWRRHIFAVMWLVYAGFYLGRKNYAIAQPVFMEEFGWNEQDVGIIITAYLTMYAIGQFVSGPLGDRYGARRILFGGFAVTISVNLLFGFSSSVLGMAFLLGLNGLGQSTGWPNSMKTMSNWFSINERGRMMAWWGTNYQIGDVVATVLAAWLIAGYSWRTAFWVPAILLMGVVALVVRWQRNRPEDVGLPPIEQYHNQSDPDASLEAGASADVQRPISEIMKDVMKNKYVWNLGISYFFLKLIRYTFLFWLTTYLVRVIGFRADKAGFMTIIFPLAGFVGTVIAGYASDNLFDARRAPVSVIMLLGLILSILAYKFVAGDPVAGPVALAFIGFMTYGPDTLISATAAMDFGSRKEAATAAGFINGLGSIGAAITGVMVGYLSVNLGWDSVFYVLMASAGAAVILQLFMWNAKGTN